MWLIVSQPSRKNYSDESIIQKINLHPWSSLGEYAVPITFQKNLTTFLFQSFNQVAVRCVSWVLWTGNCTLAVRTVKTASKISGQWATAGEPGRLRNSSKSIEKYNLQVQLNLKFKLVLFYWNFNFINYHFNLGCTPYFCFLIGGPKFGKLRKKITKSLWTLGYYKSELCLEWCVLYTWYGTASYFTCYLTDLI